MKKKAAIPSAKYKKPSLSVIKVLATAIHSAPSLGNKISGTTTEINIANAPKNVGLSINSKFLRNVLKRYPYCCISSMKKLHI